MRALRATAGAGLLIAACVSGAFAADSLLIPADRIYTAPDAPPLSQGHVLVRDGLIVAVGDERSRLAIPAGTSTSSCRGVLVAGFQNSHVHFMGAGFDGAARKSSAEVQGALDAMLNRYGFTTVFDTGSARADTLAIRERIGKGELRGPRILTAGWPLYPADGIPFYLRDLPKEVLEQLRQPRDATSARDAVRENLLAGADGTKLFVHTSPDGKEPRFMSAEVARAAAEETHRRGKLVLVHPTSVAGIRFSLAAGADVIVHTTLGEITPWDEALTREMVQRGMSVVPTFQLWPFELAKQQVPQPVVERLVGATLQELRAFKAAGGQILFGTDVGYMTDYDPTVEYEYLARAGLSAMDILASLTTAPAERWSESRQRGRVAAGQQADLVVLEADPADDIRNFARVRCAFRGGVQIYPAKAP